MIPPSPKSSPIATPLASVATFSCPSTLHSPILAKVFPLMITSSMTCVVPGATIFAVIKKKNLTGDRSL